MRSRIQIIYIVGEGRSGSTLLESILSNDARTVSVGEAYRFWERFYKNETLCGCGEYIEQCPLWKEVHEKLAKELTIYEPKHIKRIIRKILEFKYFELSRVSEAELRLMVETIRTYYTAISETSGKSIIIDSSKTPNWGHLIGLAGVFDVKFIYLERALPQLAGSWKKKIELPEYVDKKMYMPLKTNLNIFRSWFRVRILISRLRSKYTILHLHYSALCNNPESSIKFLNRELGLEIRYPHIQYMSNHGIAGNPFRYTSRNTIELLPILDKKPVNLNWLEYLFFSITETILSRFI
jgi:hypothetical protein